MKKLVFVSSQNGGPTAHGGPSGGGARHWPPAPYGPRLRRRNRRLGLILAALAIGCLLSSYWMVHRGWVRPGPVVWQFPWSHSPYKADF